MTTQVEQRPNGGPPAEGQPACNGRKNGWANKVPKVDPGQWAGEGYCKRPPGWGTDHDRGRCRLHGGNAAVKHGQYSRYLKTRLGDEIEKLEDDPDPLDLTEEVHLARALLRRALDNEELDEPNRMALVSEVSKIVKRIEDIRAQNALSIKELSRMMTEMGRVVSRHVEDQATIDEIRSDWLEIRL